MRGQLELTRPPRLELTGELNTEVFRGSLRASWDSSPDPDAQPYIWEELFDD